MRLQEAAGGRRAKVCVTTLIVSSVWFINFFIYLIIVINMFLSADCVFRPALLLPGRREVDPLLLELSLDLSTTALRTPLLRDVALTTPTARPPASPVEPFPALASPSRLRPVDVSLWTRWIWMGNMSDSATKLMR